jgi:hypothetical protein
VIPTRSFDHFFSSTTSTMPKPKRLISYRAAQNFGRSPLIDKKSNDINPQTYLGWVELVFDQRTGDSISRIDELLSWDLNLTAGHLGLQEALIAKHRLRFGEN